MLVVPKKVCTLFIGHNGINIILAFAVYNDECCHFVARITLPYTNNGIDQSPIVDPGFDNHISFHTIMCHY